jgi:hypothetical protein
MSRASFKQSAGRGARRIAPVRPCQGPNGLVAFITAREPIDRILKAIGEPTRPPPRPGPSSDRIDEVLWVWISYAFRRGRSDTSPRD